MSDDQSSTHDESMPARRGFFTRRGLLGTGGLATAIVLGQGLRDASSASAAAPAYVPAQLNVKDAHYSTTVRRVLNAAVGTGSAVRILPVDRAKFQAGATFDLRIEATGVDPETTR
ncbi:hypothetical protein GTQ99_22100, partial [Kineococcus sp. T13]|uniref:hypothetical protein n=1 Tax=Kineococcus vitellinus TaxID=2696565 RepID=UPI001411DC2B